MIESPPLESARGGTRRVPGRRRRVGQDLVLTDSLADAPVVVQQVAEVGDVEPDLAGVPRAADVVEDVLRRGSGPCASPSAGTPRCALRVLAAVLAQILILADVGVPNAAACCAGVNVTAARRERDEVHLATCRAECRSDRCRAAVAVRVAREHVAGVARCVCAGPRTPTPSSRRISKYSCVYEPAMKNAVARRRASRTRDRRVVRIAARSGCRCHDPNGDRAGVDGVLRLAVAVGRP